jgi:hypothetical protein
MLTDPRSEYESIASQVAASSGKMFGMPVLKDHSGKAFAGFYQGSMVFKLSGADHARAMALNGARLFDPSGHGRPMREWVVVPPEHAVRWLGIARQALRYSESLRGE